MAEGELPPGLSPGEKAVLILLEGIALGLALTGVDMLLLHGATGTSVGLVWALSLLVSYVGFKWPNVKSMFGHEIAPKVERLVGNYRLRVGIALVAILMALSYPILYLYGLRTDLDMYAMPRVVTSRQGDDLRDFLAKHEAHAVAVKLSANPNDHEAEAYWSQLVNTLRRTNWEVEELGTPGTPPLIDEGLTIHEEGSNSNPDQKHNPAMLLQQAFENAQIDIQTSGSGLGPYKLFLIVGRRPYKIHPPDSLLFKLGQWLTRNFER